SRLWPARGLWLLVDLDVPAAYHRAVGIAAAVVDWCSVRRAASAGRRLVPDLDAKSIGGTWFAVVFHVDSEAVPRLVVQFAFAAPKGVAVAAQRVTVYCEGQVRGAPEMDVRRSIDKIRVAPRRRIVFV